jgi:hypothetical protein
VSALPGSPSPSSPRNSAQQKYSAYNPDLLAIYEAVKFEAGNFTIFTDHK